MTNAVTTRQPNTLDADAGQLLRYLQRGGTKSNLQTFKPNRTTWYDTNAPAPALPTDTDWYFGVNPCAAIPATNAKGKPAPASAIRSQVDYIAALNCLYAEFDAKDFGGSLDAALAHVRSLALPPSVLVASGGGYHCYWLLDEPFVLDTPEKRQRAVDVQHRWVAFVGGDDDAKDIARVLRVPGTLNYKYSPPRAVTFVEQDYSRTYTLDALQDMLPAVAPRTVRTPRTNAPACQADARPTGVAQPSVDFVAISKAAAALARLRVERRDEYGDWLHVGMALRELDDDGLYLWQRWSEASQKYSVGVCQEKWTTFRIGTPGGTDITLASLYRYADEDGEPASTLDDTERQQLQDLKALTVQAQGILGMKAPMSAKAAIVGMLYRLDVKRVLVADRDDHSGSLAVNYGTFADIMNTSKATVARAIDVGEQKGLWRKDPECKQTKSGYDVLAMRLDLQPAFYRPELAQTLELNTHGGKRAGAGRKPKCATCPPGTPMREQTETVRRTTCLGCQKVLDEVTTYSTRELIPDEAGAIQDETGYATPAGYEPEREPVDEVKVDALPMDAMRQAEHADEFKMKLVNTTAAALVLLPFHLEKTRDELVPLALAETFDITAAIRLADSYAPVEDAERHAYKTGLGHIYHGNPGKALELLPNILDELACAMLAHLANRPPSLAPA